MKISRRQFTLSSLAVGFAATGTAFVSPKAAHAAKAQIYTGLLSNTGAGGYDVVAYFTDGAPVKGSKQFVHEYKGAQWRFSSEDNLKEFAAAPEKYAPQYGGYCAYAVANGYTAKGDPEAWTVHDGKLYLNFNKSVRKQWLEDKLGNIKKGDKNWPSVLG